MCFFLTFTSSPHRSNQTDAHAKANVGLVTFPTALSSSQDMAPIAVSLTSLAPFRRSHASGHILHFEVEEPSHPLRDLVAFFHVSQFEVVHEGSRRLELRLV